MTVLLTSTYSGQLYICQPNRSRPSTDATVTFEYVPPNWVDAHLISEDAGIDTVLSYFVTCFGIENTDPAIHIYDSLGAPIYTCNRTVGDMYFYFQNDTCDLNFGTYFTGLRED